MNAIAALTQVAATTDVDALGILKARIAQLEEEAKPLIEAIKAQGPGNYLGTLFDANVADVPAVESIDPKAMEAKLRELGVDGRWFTRNTKVRAASLRLTVKARK